MTTAVFGKARSQVSKRNWTGIGCCVLFATIVCLRLCIQYTHVGALYLEDDAYYYTVVAQNIAQSGRSTFDGQTLTNGYHPLWLLLLAAQYWVAPSVYLTLLIELVLATAGLALFLVSFRSQSVLFRITFAVAFTLLAWPMIEKGMEVSLLIFGLGLFTHLAVEQRDRAGGSLALGLACVLCIGARLDAAVFVLPTLLLVSGGRRRALLALAPVVIAGALYAGVNLWLFGLPFPVSGAIKSLGGLQWNEALFNQAGDFWRGPGMLRNTVAFVNSFIGRPVFFFSMAFLALAFVKPSWKSWPLCVGFVIGFVLFATKIVFFSSWVVWPWYAFPTIIGLATLFHAIEDYGAAHAIKVDPRLELAAIVLVLVGAAFQLGLAAEKSDKTFENLNIDAVAKFGAVFDGARVAMGDRAGSFAVHYPGPVTQLEGLVNDRAYLVAVQRHEDIRPLLCHRGVRYVLAYQRDLGRYDTVTIPAMRPALTRFPSPILSFARKDEVGHISDLAKYNNSSVDDGDNYLYAWRLTGCAGPEGAK